MLHTNPQLSLSLSCHYKNYNFKFIKPHSRAKASYVRTLHVQEG